MHKKVVAANPFRCRMWEHHDRLDEYITEASCRSEIASIAKHGQLVAALGRPLRDEPEFDFELIFGARRLFVARHLNQQLLVEVRELSDKDAIVAMDVENRHRRDISPYERGLSYARWIRCGEFKSQDELARGLQVSPSQVSRYLKLSRLPTVILGAFASPLEICEGWGLELVDAWEDPQRRSVLAAKARVITAENLATPAAEIFARLMAAGSGQRKAHLRPRDVVVSNDDALPVFRIRHQRHTIALLLPHSLLSPPTMERIRIALLEILHSSGSDTT